MKKLEKLKLNNLSGQSLEEREMDRLRGGERFCTCACAYVNSGGSSSTSNRDANFNTGDSGWDSGYGRACYYKGVSGTYDGWIYVTGNLC